MNYTNPRKFAQFNDWPSGNKRTKCTFAVEQGSKGQRVRRVTDKPGCPGVECAPKLTTFAEKVLLVDGDDGRIYVMQLSTQYGMISVTCSDMKYSHETIHKGNDSRYAQYLAMFKAFDEYRIETDANWIRLVDLAADTQTNAHNFGEDIGTMEPINKCELYAKERGYSIQWPGLYPLVEKVV